MEFDYYKMGYGLVTKADPTSENCNLFLACDFTIQMPMDDFRKSCYLNMYSRNMLMKYDEARGVYHRRPYPDSRSVSQDEILGFMVLSKRLGTDHRFEIWKHLITHFGSYNNTGRLYDYLPFNPGNYYSWGQFADSWLAYFFLPFYYINLVIACNKPKEHTSSRIMYWLELTNLSDNFLNRFLKNYYERKMKAMYGDDYVSYILRYYHAREDETFPLFIHLNNRKK